LRKQYPETDVSRLAEFQASGGSESPDCDSCDFAISLVHECL